MQVDAIYEDGRIRIVTPIRFKGHVIRLRIDIPDDEIEQGPVTKPSGDLPDALPATGPFIEELKAIQAQVRAQLQSAANQPMSKADIREARGDAWEEKHSG